MKTLVLGDIHGRTCWYDIIVDEQPDKIIFLGDYVSTHENISAEQQCSNLEDILNFKEGFGESEVSDTLAISVEEIGRRMESCKKKFKHKSYNRGLEKYVAVKNPKNFFIVCLSFLSYSVVSAEITSE